MSLFIHIQHPLSVSFQLDVRIDSKSPYLGLTGPSGSGKSSILHIAAGILSADQASVKIQGDELTGLPMAQRRVGLAMQSPHLFPHLNTRQNLLFGTSGPDQEDRIDEVAEWLEISELLARSPRHLSGGERQRVAIGRAVLSKPRVLLLDEPFAAVDDDRTRRIAGHLRQHVEREGIAMILVSHDQQLLEATAEQTFTVVHGRAG